MSEDAPMAEDSGALASPEAIPPSEVSTPRVGAEMTLLVDAGSAWTKAALVARTRGRWRLVAQVAQPSAWGEEALRATLVDRLRPIADRRVSDRLQSGALGIEPVRALSEGKAEIVVGLRGAPAVAQALVSEQGDTVETERGFRFPSQVGDGGEVAPARVRGIDHPHLGAVGIGSKLAAVGANQQRRDASVGIGDAPPDAAIGQSLNLVGGAAAQRAGGLEQQLRR